MRKLVVFVVLMLALGFATYTSTSAHAASVKFSKNIQIKLSVDCSHLPTSKKGLAALSQHNLCGLGKASSQVSPKTSIAGNCGNLSLNLYDDGGGVMLTQVSVTSYWYLGPIYRSVWSGSWYNLDTGSGGSMGDVVLGTGYTRTSDTYYYTDYGSIAGSLNYAQDQTVLGISCTSGSSLGASVYI